mgnify:CR=1 FL=1
MKGCWVSVLPVMAGFAPGGAAFAASPMPWYEPEAVRGDPLVAISRCGINYEYARETSSREKFVPNATWQLGAKDGKNDWALGIEVPVLINNAKWAPSEEGLGDLKVKVAYNALDDGQWLLGGYFETEGDTADTDVEAIANQRTQMALGGGFIRSLGSGWSVGAALQYGWSLDAGTTTGCKSEWELRIGARKTLVGQLNLTVVYKQVFGFAGEDSYSASVEPSLSWGFGAERKCSLWVACEVPVQNKSEDFTAKGGFAWLF